MALQEEVGRAIRRHRERAAMSQAALARATRRSTQLIGFIERGRRAPSLETLEAISAALGVPVRDFFPGPAPGPDDLAARVAALVARLSPDDQARAYRVIAALAEGG